MIHSAEEFIRLRTSEDTAEYQRAARDAAPLEVWRELVARHPNMRFWVVQNKTVPLEVLAMLARDDDTDVRCMVASKRKLCHELQHVLALDPEESVRHALAMNAKVLQEVLQLLAQEQSFVGEAAREQLRSRAAEAG